MDWSTILVGALGLGSGLVSYFASRKTNQAAAEATIGEAWAKISTEQKKQIKELKESDARRQELEKDLIRLRSKVEMLESTTFYLPIPMWLKDRRGEMLFVNDAYEKVFLLPNGLTKSDYIGKNDVEVWGEKIGKQYQKNDRRVMLTGQMLDKLETTIIDGEEIDFRIIKYQLKNGGVVIGIAGIAISIND